MMYSSYFPFHFFWIAPIMMILFWWMVVYGIVMLVRSSSGSTSALSVLKERYAKWEMTREEFEKMKKDIM